MTQEEKIVSKIEGLIRGMFFDLGMEPPRLHHEKTPWSNCCYCTLCGESEINISKNEDGEYLCRCSVWDSSFKGAWLRWIDEGKAKEFIADFPSEESLHNKTLIRVLEEIEKNKGTF